jgi:nitrite reductase/ring-hydroxylating ferredoxin subunit
MAQRFPAGKAGDIPPGEGREFMCGKEHVAVFNADGQFLACNNMCPHAGGPLHDGFLSGATITCPWHGWSFDLDKFEEARRDGLDRYRVIQEGDDLYVELPD